MWGENTERLYCRPLGSSYHLLTNQRVIITYSPAALVSVLRSTVITNPYPHSRPPTPYKHQLLPSVLVRKIQENGLKWVELLAETRTRQTSKDWPTKQKECKLLFQNTSTTLCYGQHSTLCGQDLSVHENGCKKVFPQRQLYMWGFGQFFFFLSTMVHGPPIIIWEDERKKKTKTGDFVQSYCILLWEVARM